MDLPSITKIWKYLKWLPKFILRRFFSKEKLADLVIVDVRARHESVSVNLGEIADYSLWFQVINMTPYTIELDRAEVEFYCVGTLLKSQYIKKVNYAPGENATLHISGDISDAKAKQIATHHKVNDSHINLHLEFNCKLHDFTKITRRLEGVNTKFVNSSYRLESSKNT